MKKLFFALLSFVFLTTSAFADEITPRSSVKFSVTIRETESTASKKLGRLLVGESVDLIAVKPNWFEVRLQDGRIGYVSRSWTIRLESQNRNLTAQNRTVKIHVIDVGTGLSVLVESSDFVMLYDGGSQDDLGKGNDNRIIAYIKSVRPDVRVINHLILSHPHKDHVELLPDVFDSFVVQHVWDSGTINPTLGYCNFLKKVSIEPNVSYHNASATGGFHEVQFQNRCIRGTLRIPQSDEMSDNPIKLANGVQMTMLYRDSSKHPDPNENSVVVRLDVGEKRVLLAGDEEGGERRHPSEPPDPNTIERKLIDCCKNELRSDILVVGHHGSSTSSRQEFLNAINASTYIISSGPHAYGSNNVVLPDEVIVEELRSRGVLYMTNENDIACMSSPAKIGTDSDESPGGCNNVVVTVNMNGEINTEYNTRSD